MTGLYYPTGMPDEELDHRLEQALEHARQDPNQLTVEDCICIAESGDVASGDGLVVSSSGRPGATRPLSARQMVQRQLQKEGNHGRDATA